MNKTGRAGSEKCARTLILGVGNPILKDDGAGRLLVQLLRRHVSSTDVELRETGLAGLNLVEALSGFDSAIVIDAIQSGGVPGEVYCLRPEDFHTAKISRYDQHSTGLLPALELGKSLGWSMPEDVTIVAIEAGDVAHFGEELTPDVAKAIPVALKIILELLEGRLIQPAVTKIKKYNLAEPATVESDEC